MQQNKKEKLVSIVFIILGFLAIIPIITNTIIISEDLTHYELKYLKNYGIIWKMVLYFTYFLVFLGILHFVLYFVFNEDTELIGVLIVFSLIGFICWYIYNYKIALVILGTLVYYIIIIYITLVMKIRLKEQND
jgi:hypothetical protein